MAYGNEVVLGFRYHEFDKLKGLFEVDFNEFDLEDDDDAYGELMDLMRALFESVNKDLEGIYVDILRDAGFTFRAKTDRGYYECDTPKGKRLFSPIRLQMYFDPYELGEELENSVIGIRLSGRYKPTFLDWEDEHGTMWNITFDEALLKMVDIAKNHIIKKYPMFKDANIIIRENHY